MIARLYDDMSNLNEIVELCLSYLEQEKIIVFPTDTVYGIGTWIENTPGIKRIARIKERKGRPFPILVSNVQQAKNIGKMNKRAMALTKAFWPGKLTIVVKAKIKIPYCTKDGKIGIRMPDHPLIAKITRHPLVGTSANISGQRPATTIDEAISQLGAEPDLFIDGGECKGLPSTVIDVSDSKTRILREGAIKLAELRKFGVL